MPQPKPSQEPTIFGLADGVLKKGYGSLSASRTGNKALTKPGTAWPALVKDKDGAIIDVLGKLLDVRVVKLDASAGAASSCTIAASYPTDNQNEWPFNKQTVTRREMALGIEFGNGNAKAYLEIDIAEGVVVTIPTQVAEVTVIDYSLNPERLNQDPPFVPPYWEIEGHGAASYLPTHKPGVKTMRAYALIEVDTSSSPADEIFELLLKAAAQVGQPPRVRAVSPTPYSPPPDSVGLTIDGFSFTNNTVLTAHLDGDPGTVLPLTNQSFVNPTEITADADTTGLPTGFYTFIATDGLLTTTSPMVWEIQ